MRTLLLLIVLGGLGVLAGCQERPIPIAGTVYIDGQPVQGGHIRVIPAHTRSAQAMIDKEGKFRLYTRTVDDGVFAGEHPIEIVSTERLPRGNRWLIPKKYSDVNTSGLTIKVDKPTSDLRIDLTWDGGKPFVESFENSGDAPPVGVAEPTVGEELAK
ncbi:hypothetical protein [Anatilimnocola floriformis]|uniref:hypothetical protein n=1 Tax=Anatilimnocola floriformis TaxID=2948575 RepID=UPI0020C530B4|nr:hypothetical protein [Anatilimnocola floriformis]